MICHCEQSRWIAAEINEGSMYAQKITAVLVAAMAAGSLALAAAPARAQTTPANPTVAADNKAITQPKVAMTWRPPARVTVRRRSFLDPGTETKSRSEHYQDYAFPPGDPNSRFSNNYGITFMRSPFPSCFDLPGFCR
jgi:hypothetical protein